MGLIDYCYERSDIVAHINSMDACCLHTIKDVVNTVSHPKINHNCENDILRNSLRWMKACPNKEVKDKAHNARINTLNELRTVLHEIVTKLQAQDLVDILNKKIEQLKTQETEEKIKRKANKRRRHFLDSE